jgi:hypothetical protein
MWGTRAAVAGTGGRHFSPDSLSEDFSEDLWSGRCEKIDFRICSELSAKKNCSTMPYKRPLGCRQALGSKIKSRKLKEINFFTSS